MPLSCCVQLKPDCDSYLLVTHHISCCVSLIIHKARTTFYTEFADDNSCDLGKLFRGMKAPKDSL